MCAIAPDGRPNQHCEPCLVGTRWDELRHELGTDHAAKLRKSAVNLKYPQWLSASLISSAFRIVLEVSPLAVRIFRPMIFDSFNFVSNFSYVYGCARVP